MVQALHLLSDETTLSRRSSQSFNKSTGFILEADSEAGSMSVVIKIILWVIFRFR